MSLTVCNYYRVLCTTVAPLLKTLLIANNLVDFIFFALDQIVNCQIIWLFYMVNESSLFEGEIFPEQII